MNFSVEGILRRLREEPEWALLAALVIVLVVGGTSFYVYRQYRTNTRASAAFHRSLSLYNRVLREENYDPAVEQFQEYLRRFPDSRHTDKVLYFLGKVYFVQKRYLPAMRQFRRVIEEHEDSFFYGAALLHMGYSERARGNNKRALEWFNRLRDDLERDEGPEWMETHWQRALTLRAMGDTRTARQALARVVASGTEDRRSYWTRYASRLRSDDRF